MAERTRKLGPVLRAGVYLVLSSFFLLEVTLRVGSTFPSDAEVYVSDSNVGYRIRPHLGVRGGTTNAAGFNDADHGPESQEGIQRFAFLGDSFVFGAVPRNENFAFVFGELANRDGKRFEVFNMGIPASGPENYLGVLKTDGKEQRIDVVCVVFFVGNDISQSHPDFKTRVWLGSPRAMLRSPFLVRPSGDYFYSYKMLRAGSRLVRNRFGQRRESSHGMFAEPVFQEIELRRMRICEVRQDDRMAASYRGSAQLLDQMRQESDRLGAGFFVVLAPDQFQVDEKLRAALLSKFELDPDAYDFDQPQTILRRSLESLGIQVLDLLPDFRSNEAEAPTYLPRNTHWNAHGNQVAAESIFRFVNGVSPPN